MHFIAGLAIAPDAVRNEERPVRHLKPSKGPVTNRELHLLECRVFRNDGLVCLPAVVEALRTIDNGADFHREPFLVFFHVLVSAYALNRHREVEDDLVANLPLALYRHIAVVADLDLDALAIDGKRNIGGGRGKYIVYA